MGLLDRFKNVFSFNKVVVGDKEVSTTSPSTPTDLSTLKVTELKALAKDRGLKGYSTLKKTELLELLKD